MVDLHKAGKNCQHNEPGYEDVCSPWLCLVLFPTENWSRSSYLTVFPNVCYCPHWKPCCAIPTAVKQRQSIISLCVGRYEGGSRAPWSMLKSIHMPASNTRDPLWWIYLRGIQSSILRSARPAWVTTLSREGLLLRRPSHAPGRARETSK